MNRSEFIENVANRAALSEEAAAKVVAVVFETITDVLKIGDDLRLTGFGTFTVADRAAAEGRNPRTGEKIQIAAMRQAKFKPGKRLRDELNPELRQGETVSTERAGPPTPRRAVG